MLFSEKVEDVKGLSDHQRQPDGKTDTSPQLPFFPPQLVFYNNQHKHQYNSHIGCGNDSAGAWWTMSQTI